MRAGRGASACLLGDSIHTVKPYFGLGLNSALEDVVSLNKALDNHNDELGPSLKAYSDERANQAKALVTISYGLDGGFFTFVLPLIIDGIFHKKFPKIFNPNTITLLQNEKLTFTEVQRMKRVDRLLQLTVIATVVLLLKTFTTIILSWLWRTIFRMKFSIF